jgi:TolB-like protein/Flp pilus assembly protein TadD
MSLFAELKRRNVLRVAVAYIVAGWLLAQVLEIAVNTFEAPAWVMKILVTVFALGIVPVLVVSWIYQMTPEGLRRDSKVTDDESVTAYTARKLDIAVILLLVTAIGMFAADRLIGERAVVSQQEVVVVPLAGDAVGAVEISSIAVLPFTDLSPGGDQAYFADGIAEEILNLLAKNGELRVVARTSAFKFRGEDVDLREVGDALNANRILEGSVRTAGTRVRITAQLIDAETNLHIWSETYDRELTDIFAVQDDIAGAIATALGAHLGIAAAATESLESPPASPNVGAYRLYLQGRQALARRDEPGQLAEGIRLLEQAIDADPNLVAAHGALSIAYALSGIWIPGITLQAGIDNTLAQAERTLALDSENVDALIARGHVLASLLLRFAEAEADFQRALALSPNHHMAINLAGDFYQLTGDRERALYYDTLAVELDPLDSVMIADLAITQGFDMNWQASLRNARSAQALQPLNRVAAQREIPALVHLGRFDEARERTRLLIDDGVMGVISPIALEFWIAVATGDPDEIARRLEAVQAAAARFGWDPVNRAWIAYWAGDLEACAGLIQQAMDSGIDSWIFFDFSLSLPGELAAAGIELEYPLRFTELMDRREASPWSHRPRREALLALYGGRAN